MISSVKPAALSGWKIATIGAVGALAVGAGAVVGGFLLGGRAVLGTAAEYVPVGAPFYVEARLRPSDAQDAALRDFMRNFPDVDELDLDRPLAEQLAEHLDEMLGAEGVDLSWSQDVEPWFDGTVALAVTGASAEALAGETPPTVVLVGVADRDTAASAIERITAEAELPAFSETTHAGVTVHVADTPDGGAWALTDDQLVIGSTASSVTTALDTHGDRGSSLAGRDGLGDLVASLPSDWLAFATWDMRGLVTEALGAASGEETAIADALSSFFEHQSLRGAAAISAAGDRIAVDTSAEAPTGPFALENGERDLASQVPGDVLYYSEAVNLGSTLAGLIEPITSAAAAEPGASEQLDMIESALGGDLTELVSWIDDAAIVAGVAGNAPYAGMVAVPGDMQEAERRIGQLVSFASLGALDPSSGLAVDEEEIDGVTVTTIRFGGDAVELPTPDVPVEASEVVVQLAVGDGRALIGLGDAFVPAVIGLAPSESLAGNQRYRDAVAELGGTTNAGVTWVDLGGIADAIGAVMGPMMPLAPMTPDEMSGDWLGPIDALVSVNRLEGDLLVSRAALLVE